MTREFRIGQGMDIHRLVDGRALIIGGVKIAYEKGLLGHSDADVLCHALMDAIYGAAGKEDIGKRFPSSDPKLKNANSLDLLRQVWSEVSGEGWSIGNIDCYVMAEAPRLSSYFPQMKENIANVIGCDLGRCSIRATTTEGLGFIGRGEGIFASAVVLLTKE